MPVLVLPARPVLVGGEVRGCVIVARAPRTIYQALARLRSILYPGAALALALAGVATWLLVRWTMRPLERLATCNVHVSRASGDAPALPGDLRFVATCDLLC